MKKLTFLLLASLFLLSGCGNKNAFTVKGDIKGLPSDTILVYYQEPNYKLDTIIAQKGKFDYTITPDTLTVFSLLLGGQEVIPMYAEKGETVKLTGQSDNIQIDGKGENGRMGQILQQIHSLSEQKDSILYAVNALIKENPYSYANIYLIDKYYVQDSLPDYTEIGELIKGLSGSIKDTPYMIDLQAKLDERSKLSSSRMVNNISCQDKNGKLVLWSDLKDKYVLLDFWASWNKESVMAQDSLVPVQKALKKEKFVILSLSLDLDKQAWLEACNKDTVQWKQMCDFKGWRNEIVKQQGITRLPANLLISPDRRIVAENIRGKELIDKVKQLIEQDKAREKAAKEAEKARKKQNMK